MSGNLPEGFVIVSGTVSKHIAVRGGWARVEIELTEDVPGQEWHAGESVSCAGALLGHTQLGESLRLEAEVTHHPKYGAQLESTSFESLGFTCPLNAYRWLERLEGVGPKLAQRIYIHFSSSAEGGVLGVLRAGPGVALECYGCSGKSGLHTCHPASQLCVGLLGRARPSPHDWDEEKRCRVCCLRDDRPDPPLPTPDPLLTVEGVGPVLAAKIRKSWAEVGNAADFAAMAWLDSLGLTRWQSSHVLEWARAQDGDARELLKTVPYSLLDLHGFGFRKVDGLALRAGVSREAPARVDAAVCYQLEQLLDQTGDTYARYGEIINGAKGGSVDGVTDIIGVPAHLVMDAIGRLTASGKVVVIKGAKGRRVHPAALLRAERAIYEAVKGLAGNGSPHASGGGANAVHTESAPSPGVPVTERLRDSLEHTAELARGDRIERVRALGASLDTSKESDW